MTIREKVAKALHRAGYNPQIEEPGLTTAAINVFLAAAAEQGWHMRPDEATEEMDAAGAADIYHATLAAAPGSGFDEYETKAMSCGWGETLSWDGIGNEHPSTVINRMAVEGWEFLESIPGYQNVMAEHCRTGTLIFRRLKK